MSDQGTPPGYKQTEVGVIPEDWEVRLLSDHFTIYAGGDVPKQSLSMIRSERFPHPIFANAIQRNGLYGYTAEKRSKPDSVTVTARGFLGHAEYRDEAFFPIVRLLVLEPTGSLDAKFATYVINDRVEFAIESTGVPQLTAPQIGKYSVGAPSDVNEQRAIAGALSDADGLIAALEGVIAKKRDLKQAAMQQLLTGKTRLPGFGPAVVEFKQSEVGAIPEDWNLSKLGEVCTFENGDRGINYPSGNDFVPIGIPFVNAGHLGAGNIKTDQLDYISRVKFDILGNGKFRPGDILFCLRGSLGKFAVVDKNLDEGAIASSLIIIRPRETSMTVSYFVSYLRSRICSDMIDLWAGGAAQPNLGGRELARFLIPTPPRIQEQIAIAEVLSDMDADLAALEARAAKARAVKQGMMQQLLTGKVRLV